MLLNELGCAVTIIDKLGVMPNILDEETAELVQRDLENRGITVRLHAEAVRFAGEEQVTGVELANGEMLVADACIAATGVKPNVAFLEGSGLDIGWGVRVDNRMRTNLPNIWAAGDVAETFDRMSGERYVHAVWPNATAQGEVVAHDILGYSTDYAGRRYQRCRNLPRTDAPGYRCQRIRRGPARSALSYHPVCLTRRPLSLGARASDQSIPLFLLKLKVVQYAADALRRDLSAKMRESDADVKPAAGFAWAFCAEIRALSCPRGCFRALNSLVSERYAGPTPGYTPG